MPNPLLDLLFPTRSLTGKTGAWITDIERRQLYSFPVTENKQELMRRGLNFIDEIRSGSSYENCPLLHKAIHTFKYGRVKAIAEDLAKIMLGNSPALAGKTICPVPLHWTRKFSRGFNQAELLAEIISNGAVVSNLLVRTKPTGFQMKRKKSERLSALRGAFSCRTNAPPQTVVLIDDLSTTGATLNECARTLKKAGVKRVEGWVVAHG